ncbi:MAG: Serine/threonine kinase [Myxococcales bacterium]|nr:Serine/threonine kinase [Myxococcales bacterium]
MACLSDNLAAAVAAEALSGDDAVAAREHLSACSDCRARVQHASASLPTAAGLAAAETLAATAGGIPTRAGGDLGIGAKLGRYEIRGVLGRGGMGVVYQAFDPDLARKVAIKVLRSELAADAEAATARLLREGRAIAKLAHPHVVAVFDVGQHGDAVFIAMELVDGRSLDVWIAEQPRPWREVVRVFVQAGDGLAAAHAAGLIHRDFKPANVLLGHDGRARVTDFGVARFGERDKRASQAKVANSEEVRLTHTGAMIGTPAYMPLEQLDGDEVDERSDQFSFAVSLYEALYGERPFAGLTLGELHDNLSAERVRPAPATSGVPAWLRAVVRRGLRPARADRYPSLDDLLAQLRRKRGRKRRVAAAIVGVAVAAGAIGAYVFAGGSHGPHVDCAGEADKKLAAAWRTPSAKVERTALVAAVDERTDEWRTASIALCEKPDPDPVVRGTDQSCLTSHLDSFEILAAQFVDATPGMLAALDERVHTDDRPRRCQEHAPKQYPVPLPADAAKRTLAITARQKNLRARTHGADMSSEAALALARDALALAEQSGHEPTIAKTWTAVGAALLDRNDSDGAIDAWRKAITAAERGGGTETLALGHALLASVVCNAPGRVSECDAEIERGVAYYADHPEDRSLQFELPYAAYQGARLVPELGVARLHAWIATHPEAASDPYVADQLARLERSDGRARKALEELEPTLDAARKAGVPLLTAELVDDRCQSEFELGRIADARASLAELVAIAGKDPALRVYQRACEHSIAVASSDYDRMLAIGEEEWKELGAWEYDYVDAQLALGRIAEARRALGPPPAAKARLDWHLVRTWLAQFDLAFAAGDLAAARAAIEALASNRASVPATSYVWSDVSARRAMVAIASGDLDEANAAIETGRALLVARGADISPSQQLIFENIAAEACVRRRGTDCTARLTAPLAVLVAGGMASLDVHLARMLIAEANGNWQDACKEWRQLAPHRQIFVIEAARFKRCR